MWSGFSNGEWLCCSLFAPIAYLSPQNLLTCHLIYQQALQTLGALAWVTAGFLSQMGVTFQWAEVQLLAK
jgi:hypothetical protein